MSTLQARHRGHNIPDSVTTFNEIEYDREGGVFLNRTKLVLLAIIVFLLTLFSAFLGRYTAERQMRQKADSGVADNQIPFLAVEPESYKVFLDPKLYAADGTVSKHDVDYSGRVEVIFRPKTDTSIISLHVGLLKIDGDTVLKRRLSMDTPTEQVLEDDSKYELNAEVDESQETLTVTVGETLKSGHYYSLFVNFTGTIGQNPEGGFFKVVLDNKEPIKNQWYVATKLAPRKARHLIPCVDNPKHKAIFEMSVVRSKDTRVIFNTKVRATEPYNDNLFVDHFEKTGLIRPDSLGLFMSNFKSNPIPTDGSLELTVWSPDSTHSIEIITDVVPKTLDFMTSYLATNFPSNKLDIVIVPSSVMTTTESPGLIMIKDSILGTIQKSSITEYQKSVELMVVHIIRQWLMPLRGLDRGSNEDKWLNEAIVNFLKIVNIDHIKPAWNFGTRFPLDAIQKVMFYDSWTNSEPLTNYEQHTEIYKYMNSVKGTSILRMLNNTFTEVIFKQSLREFVHTEIYKYKDTISFWTLLDDNIRNKSVSLPESSAVLQIVNTWMKNKNYPLIKLQVDGDDLIVKQFRFDYDEPKPTNDWVIPITLTCGAAYNTTVWLEHNPVIRVPGYISASNGTWILANQHQTGYYRVAYEDVLLDRISYEISNGKSFDEYTVAQLVGDIFEGAFAGVIGFSDALGFLERVIQKAGPYPGYWHAIFSAFNKIEMVLHNTKHYDSLSVYMEMVVEKAYDMFQASTIDSPEKILGKMDTLNFAGRVELKKCVWWAREQFNNWKQSTTEINPIAPNDRKSVYCTAMQYATKYDHRFMLSKYSSSKWTPDRKSIAKSFSCSRNSQFLQKIFSAEEVKFDDLTDIWQSILDNPTAGQYPFNYLRNNWETLNQEYADTNVGLLSTMLHAGIRALNSLADLEILQSFNEKYFGNTVENRNPTLFEVLRFEEEILRQKITWKEKYESVISSWITPKSAKSDLRVYKIDEGQAKTGESKTKNNMIKLVKKKQSVGGAKTEETNQENKSATLETEPETEENKSAALETEPNVEENKSATLETEPETEENKSAALETEHETEENESAALETEPETEENKSAAIETEPETEDNKSAALETKPDSEENKSAALETKPDSEENKSAAVETKPDSEENKSAALETKPDSEENKSAAVETKPETEENKSAALETEPETEDNKSAALETEPDSEENKSAALETEPETEDNKSAALETEHETEENKSAALETEPNAEENKSAALETEPDSEENKSAALETEPETEENKSAALETEHETEENESIALETEPETEENKSAALETEPNAEKNKSAALETKPDSEENKSAALETKPETEENKSAALETEPETEENKSAGLETEPDSEENKSTALETEPDAEENKSAALETEPDSEENKSAAVETKSDSEENKSAALETKPDSEENKSAALETKPDSEENKSATLEIEPETEENKSAALETEPETEENKSAAVEIIPATEKINKPAFASVAKSRTLVSTEDEQLKRETRESAQSKVNGRNEEVNDDSKLEETKKKKRKRIIKGNEYKSLK